MAAVLVAASVLSTLGVAWSVSSSASRIPDDGSSQYFNGYYAAGESINLNYSTIPDGRYWLGYSMDVVADSPAPDATLFCSFVDPNGRIDYLMSALVVTAANGKPQSLENRSAFELPSLTIALRCTPSVEGELSAQFTNIKVDIERIPD